MLKESVLPMLPVVVCEERSVIVGINDTEGGGTLHVAIGIVCNDIGEGDIPGVWEGKGYGIMGR